MQRTLLAVIFSLLMESAALAAGSKVTAFPAATTLSGAVTYLANGGTADNSAGFSTGLFTITAGDITIVPNGVTNTMLANSSMTIAGHSIALGGTQTIAASDLSGLGTGVATALGNPLNGSGGVNGTVTWPSSGGILLSNGANAPSGLAEVDGDCAVGSGGLWTTVSCASASSGITTLTGGVTASGPGSAVATVVTNANLTGPVTSVGNATTFVGPLSGDCSNSGLVITCTKSSGTAFGTAAFDNTGTSGANIPLLSAANSWGAAQRGNTETPTIATTTFTPAGTAQNIRIDFPATTCTCTIANFSTITAGQSGVIELVQGATSASLNPTWGSAYEYPGGTSTIVLTTTLGGVDYIPYYVESTGTFIVLGSIDLKPVH